MLRVASGDDDRNNRFRQPLTFPGCHRPPGPSYFLAFPPPGSDGGHWDSLVKKQHNQSKQAAWHSTLLNISKGKSQPWQFFFYFVSVVHQCTANTIVSFFQYPAHYLYVECLFFLSFLKRIVYVAFTSSWVIISTVSFLWIPLTYTS